MPKFSYINKKNLKIETLKTNNLPKLTEAIDWCDFMYEFDYNVVFSNPFM